MNEEIQVEGLSDLMKEMDDFPEKLQRKIMRGAMRAGSKVIFEEVRARLRTFSITGALADSVKISTSLKDDVANAKITVGGRVKGGSKKTGAERGAFYAHMVEFGTAAHTIRAIKAKALKFPGGPTKAVSHPGAQQRPFFRPAISTRTQAATEAVVAYIRSRVEKLNQVSAE